MAKLTIAVDAPAALAANLVHAPMRQACGCPENTRLQSRERADCPRDAAA
jgi:hypothetical protein